MGPSISSLSAFAPLSEPGWTAEGRLGLAALEPRFSGIEARAGALVWRRRPRGFAGLLRCICGQMISNAAAEAIWARLRALPGALEPESFLALDDAALCGVAGLSRPKAAHARSLARACLDGTLDFAAIAALPDAEAVARIASVKGLGPWTAGIYLLFAEDRTDVFPPGDVALAAGAHHLLGLEARPASPALVEIARAWSPWRGLAARLLWHHWRWATGRAAGEA
ncbi:DNA-3-methyladenine glycosylase family protein [Rhodovarius crocodyli]|uniref:DNA-3-methyladenine glycosylase family protein n=1 Tax=Rhodovarius crocodyli TaxID=1979269 RepID=UPI0013E3E5C1|nr:DNA-3-methyladenine glycosylase 2 family protein [Rhodovarius crocodyli]